MQNSQQFSFQATDKPIVWIDLEMTGLDLSKEHILEVAVVVTDSDLRHKVAGPNLVLACPEDVLGRMDEWNQKHHAESGLLDLVRASTITPEQAEQLLLEFLTRVGVGHQAAPLAGNSIHTDRRFLQKYMPHLSEFLSPKIIDVTTFKHLCRRWNYKVS